MIFRRLWVWQEYHCKPEIFQEGSQAARQSKAEASPYQHKPSSHLSPQLETGLTGSHLPLGRNCCKSDGNLPVTTVPADTYFLAWVPTGPASSGTGEAKWSGSPFEAQSLTAANLHHLEQQGGEKNGPRTSRPGTRTQLKSPLSQAEVRFTSRKQLSGLAGPPCITEPGLLLSQGKCSHHPFHMCFHLPVPCPPTQSCHLQARLGSVSVAPVLLQPTHTCCCCPTFSLLVSGSYAGERAAPLGRHP